MSVAPQEEQVVGSSGFDWTSFQFIAGGAGLPWIADAHGPSVSRISALLLGLLELPLPPGGQSSASRPEVGTLGYLGGGVAPGVVEAWR